MWRHSVCMCCVYGTFKYIRYLHVCPEGFGYLYRYLQCVPQQSDSLGKHIYDIRVHCIALRSLQRATLERGLESWQSGGGVSAAEGAPKSDPTLEDSKVRRFMVAIIVCTSTRGISCGFPSGASHTVYVSCPARCSRWWAQPGVNIVLSAMTKAYSLAVLWTLLGWHEYRFGEYKFRRVCLSLSWVQGVSVSRYRWFLCASLSLDASLLLLN